MSGRRSGQFLAKPVRLPMLRQEIYRFAVNDQPLENCGPALHSGDSSGPINLTEFTIASCNGKADLAKHAIHVYLSKNNPLLAH